MTEEEQTVLMIKGAISELPPELEDQCNAMVEHLRRLVADAGETVGTLAITLVGAELQIRLTQ